jgi:hypothetical protein
VDPFTGNELSFSTNCVSLQISGPSVADLSFCDLPGEFLFLSLMVLEKLMNVCL